MALAEWVWNSFRPDQVITAQQRMAEAAKIMRRCDKDENGSIDKEEFRVYYEKTCEDMFR